MEIAYQAWSETFGLGLSRKETVGSVSDINNDSADTEASNTDSAFPTPSFGDENFTLEDSLKPTISNTNVRLPNRDPSDQLAVQSGGGSPVSISCTTQVALVQPYPTNHPYISAGSSSSTVLYEAGPQYLPGHQIHHPTVSHHPPPHPHLSPDHQLPAYSTDKNSTSLINTGSSGGSNLDTDQSIRQQYNTTTVTYRDPARHYSTHYSPQAGSVPYTQQYSCVTNPTHHPQTDQYYHLQQQPQQPTQGCCPPVVYNSNHSNGLSSGLPNLFNYNHNNPQFPPQNFIDIPDITENNSVYYQYNHSAGYTPRTSYIPMAQREPILSTMDEAVGRQVPGVVNSSPVNNSDDSDDNVPLTKLTRGKVTKRKRGGRGGGRGGVDASPTGKATEGKKTRTPKKRRKRDPNEPVKPVSAYAMFFRDTQAAIKSQSPKATFGDVSKIVASMWDGLDDGAKTDYKVKTEVAKKEYLHKLAAYRASLVSQGADGIRSGEAPSPQVSPQHNLPSSSADNPVEPPTFQSEFEPTSRREGLESEEYSKPQESVPQVFVPPTTAIEDQNTQANPDNLVQPKENGVEDVKETEHVQTDEPEQGESTTEADKNETKADITEESSNGSSHTEEASVINTNVFYGKSSEQTSPSVSASSCTRAGCEKEAVDSPLWDSEYCSNQCVVEHCRDVFTAWVATRSGFASVN